MPSALDAPVLQVDANVIHKVDTSNPQNLFSMWTVFARCADNVAQGRRLENLSWRLWTRETFCVENGSSRLPGDRADSFGSVSDSLSSVSSLKPKSIPKRSQPSTEEVPQLSGSVESIADEEAVEIASDPSSTDISRPRIRRQDSCGSNRSRGRERHITSDDLEKMVVSIVQEKQCLNAPFRDISPFPYPTPESQQTVESEETEAEQTEETIEVPEVIEETVAPAPAPIPEVVEAKAESAPEAFPTMTAEDTSAIEDSEDEEELPGAPLQKSKSTTEVIRGFSPSHMPLAIPQIFTPASDDKLADDDAIPEPTSAPKATQVPSKKATFALGGSSSCEESMSDRSRGLNSSMSMSQMMKRKPASPEEEGSLKSAFHLSRHSLATKKQTSFSNHVTTRTIPSSSAVASDDESDSDDIDESAIDDDDDDSSDWEDSNEESGRSSMDEKNMFQRVDSTLHLPSRRSLITLMIQRSEHEVKNGLTTSQSTLGLPRARGQHQHQHQPPSLAASPNDSDEPALMMRHRPRGPQSTLRPINEIPRSSAQPIMNPSAGVARSPRTNRRMMLSTELTESLRRHLLWERSQKTSTANAVNVLKRRHTSHDIANLKQHPDPVHMNKANDSEANTGSWDHYLNRDAFDGYHAKGW